MLKFSFIAVLIVGLFAAFQNCSGAHSGFGTNGGASPTSLSSASAGGGNGNGYDGMVSYVMLDGGACAAGDPAASRIVEMPDGNYFLTRTNCHDVTPPELIVVSFQNSNIVYGNEVYTQSAEDSMIDSLYQSGFGRPADAQEHATWENLIKTQNAGPDEMTKAIRASLLNNKIGQDVVIAAAYEAGFGRAPSDAELATWEGLMNAGQALDSDLLAAMRQSLVGHADGQAQVIATAYEEGFGRAPTTTELATWQNLMQGGQTLYKDLIVAFRRSLINNQPGQDQVIESAYQAALHRAPTAEEKARWEEQMNLAEALYADIVGALE